MNLDYSKCYTREDVERVMAKAKEQIALHRRVLVGLAHADNGVRVEGCDCCFCAPPEAP